MANASVYRSVASSCRPSPADLADIPEIPGLPRPMVRGDKDGLRLLERLQCLRETPQIGVDLTEGIESLRLIDAITGSLGDL